MSDVLVRRLRDEIRVGGPITFARFMEVALTDPEHGYYMQAAGRPTREGDFLTAPEMHPIFGWTVARQVDECWRLLGRPARFTVREYGAGSGAFLEAIVAGLRTDGSGLLAAATAGRVPLRLEPVEVNPHRRAELAARLAAAAPEVEVSAPVAGVRITGLILANEFVDALPVHRVTVRDGRLREVLVGWEEDGEADPSVGPDPVAGRLVDVLGDPTTPALAERLAHEGIELIEGQAAEIRLADMHWLDDIARDLAVGHILVIDYGAPAAELCDPGRRPAGTLLAYRGHQVRHDVLTEPGDRDLTAHVDLTALDDGARGRGLVPLGRTSQARFLAACGLGDLLDTIRSDPATNLETYVAVRSAIGRLLDPRHMGGFAVLALGRGLPPGGEILRGLAGPDPAGRGASFGGLSDPSGDGLP